MPKFIYLFTYVQGMTNNVRYTFGVGDTTWAIYIQY